jgi:Flp pilus assembly protein TadD
MVAGALLLAGCAGAPNSSTLGGGVVTGSLAESGDSVAAASAAKPGAEAARPENMLRLAADVEARGEKAMALTFYERAAIAANGDPAITLQVADAYLRLGAADRAADAYREALARGGENGRALLGLGTAQLRGGRVQEGLDSLARAAPLVKTASAYDRLGVAHGLAGQPREALASFEQAHALAPEDADIATNLALAAALAGQHDRAVSMMTQVAASPSASKNQKRNLVLVLGLAGRGGEARSRVKDLRAEEVQALLAHANSIRGMATPKARAIALGTASSSTQ